MEISWSYLRLWCPEELWHNNSKENTLKLSTLYIYTMVHQYREHYNLYFHSTNILWFRSFPCSKSTYDFRSISIDFGRLWFIDEPFRFHDKVYLFHIHRMAKAWTWMRFCPWWVSSANTRSSSCSWCVCRRAFRAAFAPSASCLWPTCRTTGVKCRSWCIWAAKSGRGWPFRPW